MQSYNSKISMLSLYCQSINAKFDKLKLFLDDVNDQNPISIICIQVTWGHESIQMNYFSLPNYRLINANRRLTAHKGLIIYIHNIFEFKNSIRNSLLHIHLIHLKVCLSKFREKTTVIKNTLLETFTGYHYMTRTT